MWRRINKIKAKNNNDNNKNLLNLRIYISMLSINSVKVQTNLKLIVQIHSFSCSALSAKISLFLVNKSA